MTFALSKMRHGPLSLHPNVNGACLSALFHIKKCETINWVTSSEPSHVAVCYGEINGKRKFRVYEVMR